jgi:quercetin dioxygenase-like cupin family protein
LQARRLRRIIASEIIEKEAAMIRFLRAVPGILIVLVFTVTLSGQAAAPAPAQGTETHGVVNPATLKWVPAPPSLPAGATMALLTGDPSKEGLFVLRAKFPDGYKVPPHFHPTDEHVTVLKGGLMMGLGEKVDKAAMHAVAVGGYFTAPATKPHYVIAKGETIIQVTAMGPFAVTYVNAADDPRNKPKTN